MKKNNFIVFLLVMSLFFLGGCGTLDQLAGRHWIKHPETGEKLWAPAHNITWDAKDKVLEVGECEVCNDIYLYPDSN